MDYLIHIIQVAGYWGYGILFLIIFLESFPVTFFLPGDSLLFSSGFLASGGHFNMALLVLVLFLASIFGYMGSYAMGEKIRTFILQSNDRYWFKKKHIDYTEEFYARYGAKTIIIGRFVPIVRSFAPTLAGAVEMKYKSFIIYTIIGGFFWAIGITSVGFYFGRVFPQTHLYLTPIIIGIIVVSLLPTIYEYVVSKKKQE